MRSEDTVGLKATLTWATGRFEKLCRRAPAPFRKYAIAAATALNSAGVRISPRRVRQLVRNLYAVAALGDGRPGERAFLLTLTWSLPQRGWGVEIPESTVAAAHRAAWNVCQANTLDGWLASVRLEKPLHRKLHRILREAPDADAGTLAVTQTLQEAEPAQQAAFAFALYPAALERRFAIGAEGVNELGKVAKEILAIDAEIHWQERLDEPAGAHPQVTRWAEVLARLPKRRRERATQLFYHLLTRWVVVSNPEAYEEEFNRCVSAVQSHLRQC